MAAVKYTMKRGEGQPGEIAAGAGDAEAQTDTISINVDTTNLSKGDVLTMIDQIKMEIFTAAWPPA